jgi:Domain of unknown function (DUF6946)
VSRRRVAEEVRLTDDECRSVRYQLLHRTVSALIEAERFNARHAVMLVHSFSDSNAWFDDYANFARLLAADAQLDALTHIGSRNGVELYLGWVKGEAEFLTA